MEKHWWESKTVWVNVLTFLSAGAMILTPLQAHVPVLVYQIALAVVAAANIGLRMLTSQPIRRTQ